jgi:PTS system sucrose-specific IIC component
MSNSGMVGAATAVLLLTRDRMKKIAKGAIPTSILAVGNRLFSVSIFRWDSLLLPVLSARVLAE